MSGAADAGARPPARASGRQPAPRRPARARAAADEPPAARPSPRSRAGSAATWTSQFVYKMTYEGSLLSGGSECTGGSIPQSTAPCAPHNVAAMPGNGQATVTFGAPSSDSGAAITGYTVTSSPGGWSVSCAHSPCLVTGLDNGVAYTFTVTATNSVGTGPMSPRRPQ